MGYNVAAAKHKMCCDAKETNEFINPNPLYPNLRLNLKTRAMPK